MFFAFDTDATGADCLFKHDLGKVAKTRNIFFGQARTTRVYFFSVGEVNPSKTPPVLRPTKITNRILILYQYNISNIPTTRVT